MYHAMEYDSESDRVILWGGRKLEPLEDNSVWAFDYDSDTWTEWETSGGPAGALGYPTMVYLESLDRMFVFGGVDLEAPFEGDLSDQSWFFDFNINQWTSLSPTNRPRPVAIHSAACDPASGLIFVFGGERGTPYSNDTNDELWSYDPALGSWRRW
jgi:N-acetylneuraminic acid mutarotase